MTMPRLLAPLFLDHAEEDEGFRREVERLSCRALRVAGVILLVIPALALVGKLWIAPDPATLGMRLLLSTLMMVFGLVALLCSRIRCLRPNSRGITFTIGAVSSTIFTVFSLLLGMEKFVPSQLAMVLLVTVSLLPALPVQVLLFGLLQALVYWVSSIIVARETGLCSPAGPLDMFGVLMLAVLSTMISAAVGRQRYASYHAYQRSLKTAEELGQAQSQMLLNEYTASLGRISAAISHEMNSPLGALISSMDTLLLLSARQATSPPEEHPRLVQLQGEVRKTLLQSADRLRGFLARMERFTNLDRAEVTAASVNHLLEDVAGMVEPQLKRGLKLELALGELPPVVCRPQRISAAFFNVISNAAGAVDSNGWIRVTTRHTDSAVQICVEDSRDPLSDEHLENFFQPELRSAGGRVRSGNWGMFSSRQILREHGGDIRVDGSLQSGTAVVMWLPVQPDNSISREAMLRGG